jgi:glutathione synthase/RimK-type ligase-like ATP-grasp enzyme
LAGCEEFPAGHEDDAGLIEAFAARGVDAAWAVWDDPAVDWAARDLVLIRETWDYTSRLDAFLGWVDRVAASTRLLNPAPVIRWNHHKRYLLELADAGIAIVPTLVVAAGETGPAIPTWPELVVKPAVGVGGDGAERVLAGTPELAEHLHQLGQIGDLLVQPFLPAVADVGETSLVLVSGEVTHAVQKVPASGEFRIHEHRGGTYHLVEPTIAQLDLARSAVATAAERAGSAPLYARADMVPGPDGAPLLMELELIEPSLYLHHAPFVAERIAEGLLGTRW